MASDRDIPTDALIGEWKAQYGSIYRVQIGPHTFIYHQLTIAEHRRIYGASRTDCAFEDTVVEEALLYSDTDLDTTRATVPTELAGCILESSMLGSRITRDAVQDNTTTWQSYIDKRKGEITPRRDPETQRLVTDDPIAVLVVQVTQAFPAYTPDDLYAKHVSDLLDLVALSELAMGNIKPESRAPTNMPPGLDGAGRQEYLEHASMDTSSRELQEAMTKERHVSP